MSEWNDGITSDSISFRDEVVLELDWWTCRLVPEISCWFLDLLDDKLADWLSFWLHITSISDTFSFCGTKLSSDKSVAQSIDELRCVISGLEECSLGNVISSATLEITDFPKSSLKSLVVGIVSGVREFLYFIIECLRLLWKSFGCSLLSSSTILSFSVLFSNLDDKLPDSFSLVDEPDKSSMTWDLDNKPWSAAVSRLSSFLEDWFSVRLWSSDAICSEDKSEVADFSSTWTESVTSLLATSAIWSRERIEIPLPSIFLSDTFIRISESSVFKSCEVDFPKEDLDTSDFLEISRESVESDRLIATDRSLFRAPRLSSLLDDRFSVRFWGSEDAICSEDKSLVPSVIEVADFSLTWTESVTSLWATSAIWSRERIEIPLPSIFLSDTFIRISESSVFKSCEVDFPKEDLDTSDFLEISRESVESDRLIATDRSLFRAPRLTVSILSSHSPFIISPSFNDNTLFLLNEPLFIPILSFPLSRTEEMLFSSALKSFSTSITFKTISDTWN